MRSRRSIFSTPLLLLIILFPAAAAAQPTGAEVQLIQHTVNSLLERIAAASQQIKSGPKDEQLYAARGSLYVDLYRALYESNYGHYYGAKSPDLEVAAIATKAIADFNKAIEITPSAELYYKRGEMYEARRVEDVTAMFTRPPTEKLQLAAFWKFVTDPDFASAAADYAEALRLNKDPELSKEIHAKFARLYLSRAGGIDFDVPSIRKIANEPNQFKYSGC